MTQTPGPDPGDWRPPPHWQIPGLPCHDCGRRTTADGGLADGLGGREFYVVHDDVWPIGGLDGFLCVECLECRIGRRLVPGDFPDVPANAPNPADSPRLRAAKGR